MLEKLRATILTPIFTDWINYLFILFGSGITLYTSLNVGLLGIAYCVAFVAVTWLMVMFFITFETFVLRYDK